MVCIILNLAFSLHLFVCAVFNPDERDASLLPHTSSVAEAWSKVSPAGLWTMAGGKHLLLLLLLLPGQAKVLGLSIFWFLHWRIELLIFGERYRGFGPMDFLILYLFIFTASVFLGGGQSQTGISHWLCFIIFLNQFFKFLLFLSSTNSNFSSTLRWTRLKCFRE